MSDLNYEMSVMDDLIELYEKTINDTRADVDNYLEMCGLTEDFSKYICTLTDDEINSLNIQTIESKINEFGGTYGNLSDVYKKSSEAIGKTFNEFICWTLIDIKTKLNNIEEAYSNLKEVRDNRLDISRSYLKSLKTPEYRDARLKQIDFLKMQAESETDPIKKKDIIDKLDTLHKSQTFEFLNERLHKYGEKEAQRIFEAFFDKSRGVYTMERYYNNLHRLKINHAIHGQFFNLEERFLPVTYEPFNNFFLFHVIRFVAYMDPSGKKDFLYMSSLISALRDLVTNEATEEEKKTLVDIMKDFYTFFENIDPEWMKENNSNYKNHPDRIEAEKNKEEMHKKQIIASIKAEMGSLLDNDASIDNPDEYLANIIKEKTDMLAFIEERDKETGRVRTNLHSYEDIFKVFEELQNDNSLDDDDDEEDLPEVVEEISE